MSWLLSKLTGTISTESTCASNDTINEINELRSQVEILTKKVADSSSSSSTSSTDNLNGNEGSGFATLLLDGDRDFFDVLYLKDGFGGGRLAASDLRDRAMFYLNQNHLERPNSLEISVHLFMNFQGLRNFISNTLSLAPKTLDDFFKGFNTSPYPFVAVDTGSASQSADESLKNWLCHLAPQRDCQYIFLGGNHDGGYSKTLHRLSPDQRKKIILLKTGESVAKEYTELNLPSAVLSGLFDGRKRKSVVPRSIANSPRIVGVIPTTRTPSTSTSAASIISVSSSPSVATTISSSPVRATAPVFVPSASITATISSITLNQPDNLPQSSSINGTLPHNQVDLFGPLINVLQAERRRGVDAPLRSGLGPLFIPIYRDMRYPTITSFASYMKQALEKNLIELGGEGGAEWVALKGYGPRVPTVVVNPASAFSSVPLVSERAVVLASSNPPPILSHPTTVRSPYLPLLTAIRSYHPRTRILRGNPAERFSVEFKKIYSDPTFPHITDFKSYTKEAERNGYVTLGIGDRVGTEWISLSPTFAALHVPLPSQNTTANSYAAPTVTTSVLPTVSPSRVLSAVSVEPPNVDSPILDSPILEAPFLPLIITIKSFLPETVILKGRVSERSITTFRKIYCDPVYPELVDFRSYCKAAERLGLINSGGEQTMEWLKLVPASNNAIHGQEASRGGSTSADYNSLITSNLSSSSTSRAPRERFADLIYVLQNYGTGRRTASEVSSALVNRCRFLYGELRTGGWGNYFLKAARAGVVEVGGEGEQAWVSLKAEYLI